MVSTADGPKSLFSNLTDSEANGIMANVSAGLMPGYNLSNISQLFADMFEGDIDKAYSFKNYALPQMMMNGTLCQTNDAYATGGQKALQPYCDAWAKDESRIRESLAQTASETRLGQLGRQ